MGCLDIEMLRAATPGCATSVHFNHAGASLMSGATLAAIAEQLRREATLGPHEAAVAVQDRLDQARADAARLLNATAGEIAFTPSGSAGWGLAFAALPPLRAGDRILVGRQEWGGNLATMQRAAARAGARIEVIACRDDGSVDPDALAAMIDERVRLVALTWLPANGGLINDAASIGRVTRAAGIPYFVDAGQALGQIPVDVEAIGCDVLKGAGRKHLRGPRGTAILYVRRSFQARLDPVFSDVLSAPWTNEGPAPRSDARMFETSEQPVPLLLGLGVALHEALSLGVPAIRERIDVTANRLRAELAAIDGITIRDLGQQRSGLISFTVGDLDVNVVKNRLAGAGISVGANGPAYTPFDMEARALAGIVRASVSYLTNERDIDRLLVGVRDIAKAR
ncbi:MULTISPECIES: aminotransferase class V-fold PLP-dependent enzyme [unclassified Bosea (in: a-proteobacteria)]|uniref:aminotransferase class V-fold PLP-dependent enzyme n=1 Tax=unclassified Bosea (in: a-proteobacteria) TaxID=2653178 RepID=UPI000F757CC5|nr:MULTISPECIES: aminotransferase class V-fold PLP-dependent enzyme [unclassified Bosea (in: a-proteobacteria)]AZO76294.1 class V aminotransferase [Bosea sp. Tri-49]RXT26223.1 class V aminotransferase [Bosea sp. Tri-39]RXT31465.1 class V aminotransferase [Bosea sp. Tri-54]